MAQHLRYDAKGNEKYFLHAVDAREAVEMGFYFETNPVKDAEKRAQIKKDAEKEPEAPVEKKSKKKEVEPEALATAEEIEDEEK